MMGNLTFKILNPRTQPIQMRNINNPRNVDLFKWKCLGVEK